MRSTVNKPDTTETGIFRTREAPAALRAKFAPDGLVRITVEQVDENGFTAKQQAELREAIADVRNGVNMSPAFDTAEAAIAYLRSLPDDDE